MNELVHKHASEIIDVVGAGPSACLYTPRYTSIAVNGALNLPHVFDYFVCGDINAVVREWFLRSNSNCRVIARSIASCDTHLYPESKFPSIERKAVESHLQSQITLPEPVEPHKIFNYARYAQGMVGAFKNTLLYGGTIAGCAVQLAYLMGAYEIHLYGCDFSYKRGQYFYKNGDPGAITSSQLNVMNSILRELRHRGVVIRIFGQTELTEYDKRYES